MQKEGTRRVWRPLHGQVVAGHIPNTPRLPHVLRTRWDWAAPRQRGAGPANTLCLGSAHNHPLQGGVSMPQFPLCKVLPAPSAVLRGCVHTFGQPLWDRVTWAAPDKAGTKQWPKAQQSTAAHGQQGESQLLKSCSLSKHLPFDPQCAAMPPCL